MPPANDGKDPSPNNIDLNKILLPKKESGPTPLSAQRVNAGALLAQESTAAAEGIPAAPAPAPVATPPPPPAPVPQTPSPTTPVPPPAATTGATSPATTVVPPVKKPADEVASLQTFRSDIEKVVHDDKLSTVSIAAAEAERRGKMPLSETPAAPAKSFDYKSWSMVAVGVVLVLLAAAAIAFVALRPTTVPVPPEPIAPFISIDEYTPVVVDASTRSRPALLQRLLDARNAVALPVGLIEWLPIIEPPADSSATPRALTIQEILDILAPQLPPEMLRVLESPYLFGVHSFDENQPLLLLQVESYETAYAAMLKWERTLKDDLSPFFTRHPVPRIKDGTATTTASTTPQFLSTGFIDKVVENRDTRLIEDEEGNITLLWTFLGRNVILITTNEYTLREVLSRLQSAPVIPSVGN